MTGAAATFQVGDYAKGIDGKRYRIIADDARGEAAWGPNDGAQPMRLRDANGRNRALLVKEAR